MDAFVELIRSQQRKEFVSVPIHRIQHDERKQVAVTEPLGQVELALCYPKEKAVESIVLDRLSRCLHFHKPCVACDAPEVLCRDGVDGFIRSDCIECLGW